MEGRLICKHITRWRIKFCNLWRRNECSTELRGNTTEVQKLIIGFKGCFEVKSFLRLGKEWALFIEVQHGRLMSVSTLMNDGQ